MCLTTTLPQLMERVWPPTSRTISGRHFVAPPGTVLRVSFDLGGCRQGNLLRAAYVVGLSIALEPASLRKGLSLHVFEKLGVNDRTRAVTLAMELGLLPR